MVWVKIPVCSRARDVLWGALLELQQSWAGRWGGAGLDQCGRARGRFLTKHRLRNKQELAVLIVSLLLLAGGWAGMFELFCEGQLKATPQDRADGLQDLLQRPEEVPTGPPSSHGCGPSDCWGSSYRRASPGTQ